MSVFELNKGDQFIVALDISGSMQTRDCAGTTRFEYLKETLVVFLREAAQWDPDGVSFYPFSSDCQAHQDVASVDELINIMNSLRVSGITRTHLPIIAAYQEHKAKGSEQTFLLIFTDGEPSDPDAVKRAIVDITNDVKDEKEFRIGILTVGERSPQLDEWLTNLDDNLTEAKYDIVDVHRLEEADFEQAVANAIEG